MKKSLLAICWQQRFAIALTTAAISLAFSGQANAGGSGNGGVWLNAVKLQGWRLNGIEFQGWHLNGIRFKGTNMQATKLQGMELQSLKVEGGELVAVTPVAAE